MIYFGKCSLCIQKEVFSTLDVFELQCFLSLEQTLKSLIGIPNIQGLFSVKSLRISPCIYNNSCQPRNYANYYTNLWGYFSANLPLMDPDPRKSPKHQGSSGCNLFPLFRNPCYTLISYSIIIWKMLSWRRPKLIQGIIDCFSSSFAPLIVDLLTVSKFCKQLFLYYRDLL